MYHGVEFTWNTDSNGQLLGVKLAQPLYVNGMLRRFGLEYSKPARSPMVELFFSSLDVEEDESPFEVQLYQQMTGSLLYLAFCTRLDILAPVLILARFQKAPTRYCHRAVKRVLMYLRGTTHHGLVHHPEDMQLNGCVDSDYAGDSTDRQSLSGFMIKLETCACFYGVGKQASVALSTAESEYYALVVANQELMWILPVFEECGLPVTVCALLRSDDQCAIEWAVGARCPSARAKHIDVKIHFIQD